MKKLEKKNDDESAANVTKKGLYCFQSVAMKNLYKLSLTTERSNSLNFNNQSYFKKKKRKGKSINQSKKCRK